MALAKIVSAAVAFRCKQRVDAGAPQTKKKQLPEGHADYVRKLPEKCYNQAQGQLPLCAEDGAGLGS